jgi:hypothetical protein
MTPRESGKGRSLMVPSPQPPSSRGITTSMSPLPPFPSTTGTSAPPAPREATPPLPGSPCAGTAARARDTPPPGSAPGHVTHASRVSITITTASARSAPPARGVRMGPPWPRWSCGRCLCVWSPELFGREGLGRERYTLVLLGMVCVYVRYSVTLLLCLAPSGPFLQNTLHTFLVVLASVC